ncbi:MAG: MBL fold metallo-hydrolase [Phycisphaeraceae bacterium]|nr:MBL fold metallo-hydrolase [Phycisphaeraceae bacterium]
MQMTLRFLGAAQNVTGSRYLLETNGCKILVDCGLYQEREFQSRNWDPFVVPPAEIDAVFLTHAHLDHCGLLPKLVKEGYSGPIYCTEATADIAKIIILDAAKLQEEDAAYKQKRHKKEGRKGPFSPGALYTIEDALACFPLFSPLPYKKTVTIREGIDAKLYEAGHVLGSSLIKITVNHVAQARSVLFTGDMGRSNKPILRDPSVVHEADYVLVESTYGDRVHHSTEDVKQQLSEVINRTMNRGGTLIVPSFALERSQEVLYHVNELLVEGAIAPMKVFVDSPMATSITKVFAHHPELYDKAMKQHMNDRHSPFTFPGLQLVETKQQSQAITESRGPTMVIAGSGMCTGGRVKHHLVRHITCPEDTIMFVGYQAGGTLGRNIVDGQEEVRILGENYRVEAEIVQVHGFSAHADKTEILQWLRGLETSPKKVFVVHGEAQSAFHFQQYLQAETGWDVTVPAYQDAVALE